MTWKPFFMFNPYNMEGKKKLEKLEYIRGLCAVYVALGHLFLSFKNLPWYILLPFKFGQEAVMAFFLISGFVIHVSNKHTDSFKTYFVKRFRRIYGPVILVFIISITIYYYTYFTFHGISLKELLGNLLMLQDFEKGKPGNWFNCFLGNSPLWSLSYEWCFYMLYYPVLKFFHKKKRLLYVFMFSTLNWFFYLLVPNHLALVSLIFYYGGVEQNWQSCI